MLPSFSSLASRLKGGLERRAAVPPAPPPIAAPPRHLRTKHRNLETAKVACGIKEVALTHRPLEAYLETTNYCNLRCRMCAIVWDPKFNPKAPTTGLLTLETVRRLEPILPAVARCYLMGTGEPMVSKYFFDIVAYLKQFGPEVHFNSNATLMTREKAERLLDLRVDSITYSIDGATPATYEAIRVNAHFDRVMANIAEMSRLQRQRGLLRPYTTMAMVVMANNVHEVGAMVELAAELGVPHVHYEPLIYQEYDAYREFYNRHSLGVLPRQQVAEYFAAAREAAQRLGVAITSQFFGKEGSFDYPELLRQEQERAARLPGLVALEVRPPGSPSEQPRSAAAGPATQQAEAPAASGKATGDADEAAAAAGGHDREITLAVSPLRVTTPYAFNLELQARLPGGRGNVASEELTLNGQALPLSLLDLLSFAGDGVGRGVFVNHRFTPEHNGTFVWTITSRDGRRASASLEIAIPADFVRLVARGEALLCTEPWTTIFMTWDGDIQTCCASPFVFGNVRAAPIEEIWNSPAYHEVRAHFSSDSIPAMCATCVKNGRMRHIIPEIEHILSQPGEGERA
ncbi:MAG: radical SAM protein [Candidatus Tectomicrobia bacterium]|nr:radical SAM protein [Candidatus Tectomicrobia bacterium]